MARTKESQDKNPSSTATRGLLLDAAKEVFSQKGFKGATVREICDRAGVNVCLISYYFGSKKDLYRECLSMIGNYYAERAALILHAPVSPEDCKNRILHFVERYLEDHMADHALHLLVNRELEHNSDVFGELIGVFFGALDVVNEFFRACQEKGFVRDDFPAEMITQLFTGSMLHQMRIEKIKREYIGRTLTDPEHRTEVARCIGLVLYEGLVPKPQASN